MVVHYQIKISDLYISWAPPQSFHVLPVYCISTQWGTMFLVTIRVFVFTFCVVKSLSPICFSCFAIVYPWLRAKYNIEFDFYCVPAPPPPQHPLNYTRAVQRWELTHIWECLSGLQWPEGWAQRGVCSVLYHITYRMLQAQDSGQGWVQGARDVCL